MSGVQGGKFWTGFASGSLSSLVSSFWSGGDNIKDNGDCTMLRTVWNGLGGKFSQSSVGILAFGTIAGGAGASLSKGNFWQGAVTGLVVSGLNHAAHTKDSEDGVLHIIDTNDTNTTDEKPFVLNESKRTIHYKPESTNEALPLGSGEKTYDLVDGINVRGKVYKVNDGYTSVTVTADFVVRMDYSKSGFIQTIYALAKGGLVTRSDFKKDDTGWDNLFKIKN
ncbi:MAG: hypothetical protein ACK4RM_09480 [Flavobacterium sp.]